MNRRVIKSVLRNKVNAWAESIDDPTVKAAVLKDTIVTGGAIASMLLSEEVKDFDVYFKTKATTKLVAQYYVEKFNEHPNRTATAEVVCSENRYDIMNEIEKIEGMTFSRSLKDTQRLEHLKEAIIDLGDRVKIFVSGVGVASLDEKLLETPFEDVVEELTEKKEVEPKKPVKPTPYRPVFLSSNAITLTDDIQVITRFYGEVEEIHKNFDFVHATNCWTSCDNKLDLKPEALECLLTKELKYRGSKYPLCSIIRMRKFIKRGFHINAGEILKMCMNLNNFDLTDVNVLQDQCTGVDSAYFDAMIQGIKTQIEKDVNFKIENNYVYSIIDKIF